MFSIPRAKLPTTDIHRSSVRWIATTRATLYLRKTMGQRQLPLIDRERNELFESCPADLKKLIKNTRKDRNMLLSNAEAMQVFMAVSATREVPGDIAEVGVYRGGSARIICEAKEDDRTLHLFDTFEGLPEVDDKSDLIFKKGLYKSSYDEVKNYLAPYPNVEFYKGLFPDTAGPVEDKKFSFVNLDVDLYKSTLAGLEFFYPRLSPGGILISHDYSTMAGVKRAFKEFFAENPEFVKKLPGSQCIVIKE